MQNSGKLDTCDEFKTTMITSDKVQSIDRHLPCGICFEAVISEGSGICY